MTALRKLDTFINNLWAPLPQAEATARVVQMAMTMEQAIRMSIKEVDRLKEMDGPFVRYQAPAHEPHTDGQGRQTNSTAGSPVAPSPRAPGETSRCSQATPKPEWPHRERPLRLDIRNNENSRPQLQHQRNSHRSGVTRRSAGTQNALVC